MIHEKTFFEDFFLTLSQLGKGTVQARLSELHLNAILIKSQWYEQYFFFPIHKTMH
jgi:hypothetical protein